VKKPKILIVSDTPAIDTGMGIGHRNLAQQFFNTNKYEVASFGWFWNSAVSRKLTWEFPWKQYNTSNEHQPYGHPEGWPRTSDNQFKDSAFYRVINEMFKPDVVIAMGDFWMCDYLYTIPNRTQFKLIHEIPIDGEPIPSEWTNIIKTADAVVSMSEYGRRVIEDNGSGCKVHVINRGVHHQEFFPINLSKEAIRDRCMPSTKGRFVYGVFDRFQDRKQIGRVVEAFAKLLSDGKHEDCDLYLHMDMNDDFSRSQKKSLDGPDGLINRYGVREHVIINNDLSVEKGVPTDQLNLIYNACDVKVSATQGEGWGLTTAEAMAAGVPCIATNYTTMPELLSTDGSGGLLADPAAYITGMYNIERAIVDTNHLAIQMDKLYRSPSLRDAISQKALKRAHSFRWDNVFKKWQKLVDTTLEKKKYHLFKGIDFNSNATKDIDIYGAVRENTGWAITTRGIASALSNRKWNVNIEEGGGASPDFVLDPSIAKMMNNKLTRNFAFINHMPAHAFNIAMKSNASKKVIYFPFELSHMTFDIVGNLNRACDVYLCPTQFVKTIADRCGVLNAHVIPLASDINTLADPIELPTKKKYKFLMLGNLGDKRKNVRFAIKAFLSCFTANDDVCLVLKSTPGHQDSDPTKTVEYERKGLIDPAEIVVQHADVHDVSGYYSACDCLLMPSKCEGWGHPAFEALKFGMPIIASNYGGYVDFAKDKPNVHLINGTLELAEDSPEYKFREQWFEPNFDEFCGAMRKAETMNVVKTGTDYVADYSWDRTAKAIEDVLDNKIYKDNKTKVYYEKMIVNQWNRDNLVGFKTYAPKEIDFVNDASKADYQILDITRLSDINYLRCDNYVIFFHCFGEWSEENPSDYKELFSKAKLVYSHLDLAPMFPYIDSSKFMRGPWGCQPDIWFNIANYPNEEFEILCTGEIAKTEGIEECIAATDFLNKKMMHVGNNMKYRNKSYNNKSRIEQQKLRELYNHSKWVSALRRIEGFEKPAIEGLLCGARPICFDTPLYRYWYGDLARYVVESDPNTTTKAIINVMSNEYSPITTKETKEAIRKFAWFYVAKNFWQRFREII